MVTMGRYQDCIRFKAEYEMDSEWLIAITEALKTLGDSIDRENTDYIELQKAMEAINLPL